MKTTTTKTDFADLTAVDNGKDAIFLRNDEMQIIAEIETYGKSDFSVERIRIQTAYASELTKRFNSHKQLVDAVKFLLRPHVPQTGKLNEPFSAEEFTLDEPKDEVIRGIVLLLKRLEE